MSSSNSSHLICHHKIKPNTYIPPAPKFPVRFNVNESAALANTSNQLEGNGSIVSDEEFESFLVTSFTQTSAETTIENEASTTAGGSMMSLLSRQVAKVDLRMEVKESADTSSDGVSVASLPNDTAFRTKVQEQIEELRRKIHGAAFVGVSPSQNDVDFLTMASPSFGETLRQQQILSVAQNVSEKRTFVMQELALMSLKDDFNVRYANVRPMETPETFLQFIYKTMTVNLNNLLTYPDAIRVVFEFGRSHQHFDYFYEVVERVLLGLISLRNLVSKPWNRAIMATGELMAVMNLVMRFALSACSETNCSIATMKDLRARLIDVWLSKVMFILKHVALDLIFDTMPRPCVDAFLNNLQDIFFLEDETYATLSLNTLEIMHLLTVVRKTDITTSDESRKEQNASSEPWQQDEDNQMEDTENVPGEQTTATDSADTTSDKSAVETQSDQAQDNTPVQVVQPTTKSVSVRLLARRLRQRNLTFFQSSMQKIVPALTALIVPTHVLIRNTTHIMCRAYVLHLLRRFASTDLVTLAFKNQMAATDNMVIRLATVMPVQPKPRMYIESTGGSDISVRRISSLRNEDDLQRICAEIIVGFSETASAIQQLKQSSDKITMICMLAPDEVAELMTNCLYSREVSLTVIGDSMEEEISDTIVEDTMEDLEED